MTETIEASQSKETKNYAVFDAPDERMVGTYVALEAAEELGEDVEFEVSEDEGNLDLTLDKETTNYGVFSDSADAVETAYISHEVLANVTGQDADSEDYETPESITMTAGALESGDTQSREEAAEQLVGGDSDDSDEEDAEDVEIANEELGLEAE